MCTATPSFRVLRQIVPQAFALFRDRALLWRPDWPCAKGELSASPTVSQSAAILQVKVNTFSFVWSVVFALHVCRGQRLTLGVLFSCSPPYFWAQSLSELVDFPNFCRRANRESSCFQFSSAGIFSQCWGCKLGSSHVLSEYFNDRATFLHPCLFAFFFPPNFIILCV